jgi:hypothetical protein
MVGHPTPLLSWVMRSANIGIGELGLSLDVARGRLVESDLTDSHIGWIEDGPTKGDPL